MTDAVQPIRGVIERWHRYLAGELPGDLEDLLSDEVVFYSPIVFTPQRGKQITRLYLQSAAQVLGSATFRYTRQLLDADTAVLEFETDVDGRQVNGVDVVRCDSAGRIVEFRVMLRPLQAIQVVHERMRRQLETAQGASPG